MANIKTSIKRQSLMFAELRNAGFIRFSKKIDNLNVQVLFMTPGETAIHIQDFRNLGYQYLKILWRALFRLRQLWNHDKDSGAITWAQAEILSKLRSRITYKAESGLCYAASKLTKKLIMLTKMNTLKPLCHNGFWGV